MPWICGIYSLDIDLVGSLAHTLLGARETGAVLLARLGAVGSSLSGRDGVLGDSLHWRLGDIGALVIVT